MKKKALKKDFYMEIRRSLGRFLSIFFIVAIGVAFFSGIRATEPDMRLSGDAYFDKTKMTDIEVISTLGLTDDDLGAIAAVDGVEEAEGGYSTDVLCADGENQIVVHVMSILPTMNEIQLEEGRLPEKADECVIDIDMLKKSELKMGDEITVSAGGDAELSDTLVTDTYKIVGLVSSPCYISFTRGSTTIGNGSIAGFICVPESSFCMDVYTEIYARVEGASELTAFTPEYDARIDVVMERVESIKKEREEARYQEVKGEADEKIADAQTEIDDARQELADGKQEADSKLADAKKELEDAQKELDSGRQKLEDSRRELEDSRAKLASTEQELTDGQTELDASREELNAQINALNAQIDQLNVQKEQYNALLASGAADPQTLGMLQMMEAKIQEADAAIAQAKVQIEAGKAQIETAQAEINHGWKQVEEGYAQLADGEQKLVDAEKEIRDGESELQDGWKEYEEARLEAEQEIADGEQKLEDAIAELEDAREEVADIDRPKWYVYDRSHFPEHTSYGDNADRMRAIGEVFPVLFFLVAALISLTTMTRMVEEQRTLIGTLKALGYDKKSIAAKYLGYAALATAAGCVVGVLIGEKIFPYIIITAYRIMYRHIFELCLPYNLKYALMASGAALFCTLLATFFSCGRELREQAAELMRPPAPKQGQRVALERIPFIWRRLNFTWKATVRNLVRYKKRFFMTVFGIGGCMALMLVGFGLKDSIIAIATLQYDELHLFDGNVILNSDAEDEEKEEACSWFQKDSRVEEMTESLLAPISVKSDGDWFDIYLSVPADAEHFHEFVVLRDRVTQEEYELDGSGAVLTEKMAAELDVQKGDTITLRDEDKGDFEVKIVNICENYMAHYLYMTPDLYEEIFGEPIEPNCIYYTTPDRTTQEAKEIGEDALKLPGTLSVTYTTEMKQQVEDMLKALDLVIVVLIISAGMLAFVVLYNLNNINITERKRELATLKVLGFYSNEVSAYVYRENIVLTLIGSVFGLLLGKILHRFIIVTVEIESVMFGRNIEPLSFLYGFLLTVAFSFFVNGVMYFKLKRINMVESLKSVE